MLIITYYFTRWDDVVATKNVEQEIIIDFVEKLITMFGIPIIIISKNGMIFLGVKVTKFEMKYGIYWKTYLNYYP